MFPFLGYLSEKKERNIYFIVILMLFKIITNTIYMYKCTYCLKSYRYKSGIYKHEKNCIFKKTPKISVKEDNKGLTSVINQMNENMTKLTEKIENLEKKPYQINNNQNIIILTYKELQGECRQKEIIRNKVFY